MGIRVRSAVMPKTDTSTSVLASVAGTLIALDFSNGDGSDNDNETILAYSLALSHFQVSYATNDSDSSEKVAEMWARLIPNVIGKTIYVTANVTITDYDGHGASEAQDVSDRNSFVVVSAIAYVGTSLPANNAVVLCNAYDLDASGAVSNQTISYTDNPLSSYFISGFDVYRSDAYGHSDSPSAFLSAAQINNPQDDQVSFQSSTSLTFSDSPCAGTGDVGFISASGDVASGTTEGVILYQLQENDFDWTFKKSSKDGFKSNLSVAIDVPPGCALKNAALLIQSVQMTMQKAYYIQEVKFGAPNGLSIDPNSGTGSPVTGEVEMSMWGEGMIESSYIQQDGTSMIAYIIAEYGPA